MKKYLEDFLDFGPGVSYHPADAHIAYYKSLKQQAVILREDMLQVSYGNDSLSYVLDVG